MKICLFLATIGFGDFVSNMNFFSFFFPIGMKLTFFMDREIVFQSSFLLSTLVKTLA
jgi:hypothetical protein